MQRQRKPLFINVYLEDDMPLLSQFAHDVGEALALDAAAGLPPAQEGGAAVGEAHALVPLNTVIIIMPQCQQVTRSCPDSCLFV